MPSTEFRQLVERLFTGQEMIPASLEDIRIVEEKVPLPEQYKELLSIVDGKGIDSQYICINPNAKMMNDMFDAFEDIEGVLYLRELIIGLIKEWDMPFEIEEYCKMLNIGRCYSDGSFIMIGITPENWGQIFWFGMDIGFSYCGCEKISDSLFDFLKIFDVK
jgi:cell wall assembly regulator SMI1